MSGRAKRRLDSEMTPPSTKDAGALLTRNSGSSRSSSRKRLRFDAGGDSAHQDTLQARDAAEEDGEDEEEGEDDDGDDDDDNETRGRGDGHENGSANNNNDDDDGSEDNGDEDGEDDDGDDGDDGDEDAMDEDDEGEDDHDHGGENEDGDDEEKTARGRQLQQQQHPQSQSRNGPATGTSSSKKKTRTAGTGDATSKTGKKKPPQSSSRRTTSAKGASAAAAATAATTDEDAFVMNSTGKGKRRIDASHLPSASSSSSSSSAAMLAPATPTSSAAHYLHHQQSASSAASLPSSSSSSSSATSKGLRHFSMRVCQKVKQKGVTTYNEVADELVHEITSVMDMSLGEKVPDDQKNLRRRVYDALNVLMAMNIIAKDKKDIRWISLPTNAAQECEQLEEVKTSLQTSLKTKRDHIRELIVQQVAFQSLVQRNHEAQEKDVHHVKTEVIKLPFIVVKTDKDTEIDCQMEEDRTEYFFDFKQPFEVLDDIEVLKRMGMSQGLDIGLCEPHQMSAVRKIVAPELLKYVDNTITPSTQAQQQQRVHMASPTVKSRNASPRK